MSKKEQATAFLQQSVPTRIVCNGTDQLTKKPVVLPAGTGPMQINSINEALARIDLSLEVTPCIELVRQLDDTASSSALYVMISNCMRTDLQEAFLTRICNSAGGMWIAPLYEDMELKVSEADDLQIVRWEVDPYAS